ncbi:putative GNAT family N-acyltransferase [Plasticicumulans lactativorans]|uniref:Putative GNAT family N-acyltransferase n=1 Tax=Plasticicumulans lactativorans TaxID=1133106 RepID=A0A4R2KWI9_9GAMM|nr:GNAT family N-acetyltransferase [Plasticicumulans lactativorans]TCO78901.1 putative GNAT family N-acyltransferase [Plasticicumulans lactativorans]
MTRRAADWHLAVTDWTRDHAALYAVRHAVFVEEQGVPVELEQDHWDALSRHVLVRAADGTPVATGRLLPDGHIGRLAVLRAWRGQGLGQALMARLVELAREAGLREVVLNAQLRAEPFYAALGFVAEGDTFIEAGIAHRVMRRRLA